MKEIKSVKEVKAMTVAQLRKVAPQFGIKNAKQYKRVDLEQLVIDAVVAKANKDNKATKTTASKKARTVSDEMVQEIANELLNNKVYKKETLMEQNRKVLIQMMKALHCKMWYRTYDKATMVAKIIEATA